MTSRRPKISIHEKAEFIDRDRDLWRCRECEQELKGTSVSRNSVTINRAELVKLIFPFFDRSF